MTYENAVQRLVREHAARMAARDIIEGQATLVAVEPDEPYDGAIPPVPEVMERPMSSWFGALTPSTWELKA